MANTTQIASENVLFKGLARTGVSKDQQRYLTNGLGAFPGHLLLVPVTQSIYDDTAQAGGGKG